MFTKHKIPLSKQVGNENALSCVELKRTKNWPLESMPRPVQAKRPRSLHLANPKETTPVCYVFFRVRRAADTLAAAMLITIS